MIKIKKINIKLFISEKKKKKKKKHFRKYLFIFWIRNI